MGPQTKEEDFIDPDHPIMKPIKIITKEFGEKEEQGATIRVFWGVKGVNTENDDMWDPEWINAPIFDDSLDVSPQANQQFLVDVCAVINAKDYTKEKGFNCWINNFKKWILTDKPTITYNGGNVRV